MRENDASSLTSVQDCDRRARESERGRLGRASERAPRAATNDNEEALDIALGRLFSWATLEVEMPVSSSFLALGREWGS